MIIYALHTPKQGFLLLLIYKKEILFNMEIQIISSSCVRGGVALATEESVNLLSFIFELLSFNSKITLPPPDGYSLYLRGRIFVGFQISSFNFHLSSLIPHPSSFHSAVINPN